MREFCESTSLPVTKNGLIHTTGGVRVFVPPSWVRGVLLSFLALLAMSEANGQSNAQRALEVDVATAVNKNLFWDTAPVLSLRVVNHTENVAEGVRCEVHVEDQYYLREVWSGTVEFPPVAAGQEDARAQTVAVPYGVFTVRWAFSNAQGVIKEGTLDIAKMIAPCYRDAPDSIRNYERRWGLFGGVWGFHSPDLATDMGTRWIRYEDTTWGTYEKERSRYDMTPLLDGPNHYGRRRVECTVQRKLYQHPAFYEGNRLSFTPGCGEVVCRATKAACGLNSSLELGDGVV